MKTKGKKVSKTVAKRASAEGGRIALKTICAKLGIDPKRARVKLRRAWRKGGSEGAENLDFHSKGSRWDLSPAQAKEVTAILSA